MASCSAAEMLWNRREEEASSECTASRTSCVNSLQDASFLARYRTLIRQLALVSAWHLKRSLPLDVTRSKRWEMSELSLLTFGQCCWKRGLPPVARGASSGPACF